MGGLREWLRSSVSAAGGTIRLQVVGVQQRAQVGTKVVEEMLPMITPRVTLEDVRVT